MPSIQQSERASVASNSSNSSAPKRPPPKSLIVSNVSVNRSEQQLFDQLNQDYQGIKRVTRNYDNEGYELASIRVDFYQHEPVLEILDEDALYIGNTSHHIRPFWPTRCFTCKQEGHIAAQCPKQPVSAERFAELIGEQQRHIDSMISEFESRWNQRFAQLESTPRAPDMSAVLPITQDVATVCQQVSQQNAQLQKQLATIVTRLQSLQTAPKQQ